MLNESVLMFSKTLMSDIELQVTYSTQILYYVNRARDLLLLIAS
jgi:hypothetical protein